MSTLNISLPAQLEQFAKEQDKFRTPSDYVASLIQADQQRQATQHQVEEMLLAAQKSIDAGDGIEMTPESWAELKTELHASLSK